MTPKINFKQINAQVKALKDAGAQQIDPTAWDKMVADLKHTTDEYQAAIADGKIGLVEAIGLAQDAMTLAGDLAALMTSVFGKK